MKQQRILVVGLNCLHNMSFSMWNYDSIYRAFINYYQQELRTTQLTINISVIVIATQSPRVLVRFTLTNIQNHKFKQWTTILVGEAINSLIQNIKNRVATFKRQLE